MSPGEQPHSGNVLDREFLTHSRKMYTFEARVDSVTKSLHLEIDLGKAGVLIGSHLGGA